MLTREENELLCRTGPGTPMGDLFRRFWIPALLSSELPTPDCPPVRVKLMGEDLVAFRDSEGKVGIFTENCPHRRASLFFGRNEEGGLRCAYHGWKYDVSGNCVDMPNEPAESNFKNKVHITAYQTQEKGGLVWAFMGPKDKVADFPQMEWTTVPDSHIYIDKVFIECNYFQAMEGENDNSHVSFLHSVLNVDSVDTSPLRNAAGRGTGGASFVQYQMIDKQPRGFVKQMDYGVMMGWRRDVSEENYHWRINQWLMPFTTIISGPPGATQIVAVRPPCTDETSWGFIAHWNAERPLTASERAAYQSGQGFIPEKPAGSWRPIANKDNDYLIDRSLQKSYSFTGIQGSIYNQDRSVTESMGGIVDRTKEHLGAADIVVIAERRRLIKAARDLQNGIEPLAARDGSVYKIRGTEGLLKKGLPFDEGFKEGVKVQPLVKAEV